MRKIILGLGLAAALAATQPALLDSFKAILSSFWGESVSLPPPPAQPPQTDEGCGADPNGCPKGS